MRLGNILAQQGGTVETGRPVKFQIRQRVQGGRTTRKWCNAVILPLGEDERAAALAAARAYVAEHPEADLASEQVLQLAQRFLHNPDNLAEKFIEAKDLALFRSGVAEDQLVLLTNEYRRHIELEYPELQPPSKKEQIEAQIKLLQAQLEAMRDEAAGE